MKPTYRLLNHTADLRIRVTGKNMAALFENAGLALADLICHPEKVDATDTETITVGGEDPPDLLVNTLRELLYLWNGHDQLIKRVEVTAISETNASVEVAVEAYTPTRHTILNEIKAVTYHQVTVEQTDAGWQAIVVFDI